MRNVLKIAGLLFLLFGCATANLPAEKEDVFLPVPVIERSDEQIGSERLRVRLAKSFILFRCPNQGTFEEYELDKARESIFKGDNANSWVRELDRLVQLMTNGDIHVTLGKSDDFLALYEGMSIHLKVFSGEKSRVYTIYEERDDVYCDDPLREYSSNLNPG